MTVKETLVAKVAKEPKTIQQLQEQGSEQESEHVYFPH